MTSNANTTDFANERQRALKRPRPGAVAVLICPPLRLAELGGVEPSTLKTLAIRRSQYVAAPGKLCFPGGGIEPGESPEDAVRREFREEVGIELADVKPIAQNHTPDGAPLFWFVADADAEGPDALNLAIQADEVASCEWLTLAEMLDDPDFLPNNLQIVRALVDRSLPLI